MRLYQCDNCELSSYSKTLVQKHCEKEHAYAFVDEIEEDSPN